MYFDTLPTVIWRTNQTRLHLFLYDWLSEPSIQPDLVVVVPTMVPIAGLEPARAKAQQIFLLLHVTMAACAL